MEPRDELEESQLNMPIIKVVLSGSSGVGKSNIISKYVKNKFGKADITVGVELATKVITRGDKTFKLQVWDTAGQQRYRALSRTYYNHARAVIIVYDIISQESFRSIKQAWYPQYEQLCSSPHVFSVIVGNKLDLQQHREVSKQKGQEFADSKQCRFFEVSAASGENLNQLFEYVIQEIIERGLEIVREEEKNVPKPKVLRTEVKQVKKERINKKCC